MRKHISVVMTGLVLAACTGDNFGPHALTDEDRQNQAVAAKKIMCRIEHSGIRTALNVLRHAFTTAIGKVAAKRC